MISTFPFVWFWTCRKGQWYPKFRTQMFLKKIIIRFKMMFTWLFLNIKKKILLSILHKYSFHIFLDILIKIYALTHFHNESLGLNLKKVLFLKTGRIGNSEWCITTVSGICFQFWLWSFQLCLMKNDVIMMVPR